MTTKTYTLTFNNIALDTTNLRMDKRGWQEVIEYFLLDESFTINDEEIVDVASFRKALEADDATNIKSIDGEQTVVEVTLTLPSLHKAEPPTLACMATHMDGAHCGLGDWYGEIEEGIQAALNDGPERDWTTGWYASKKEIASARITNADGGMLIEVSVSDDFDTPGLGERIIQHTTDIEEIRAAIYEAWEEAEGDQKDNRMYVGFSILTETDYTRQRFSLPYVPYWLGRLILRMVPSLRRTTVRSQGWVETYIKASGEGAYWCGDSPPGDSYHTWGFQDEYDIPEDVKEELLDWIDDNDFGSHTVGEFTVKAWDEAPCPKD